MGKRQLNRIRQLYHDMKYVVDPKQVHMGCWDDITGSCAAGWFMRLHPRVLLKPDRFGVPRLYELQDFQALERFFGLSEEDTLSLFGLSSRKGKAAVNHFLKTLERIAADHNIELEVPHDQLTE